MNQTRLYEESGVDSDATPLDTMFNLVGVGIAVGFAMLDHDGINDEGNDE